MPGASGHLPDNGGHKLIGPKTSLNWAAAGEVVAMFFGGGSGVRTQHCLIISHLFQERTQAWQEGYKELMATHNSYLSHDFYKARWGRPNVKPVKSNVAHVSWLSTLKKFKKIFKNKNIIPWLNTISVTQAQSTPYQWQMVEMSHIFQKFLRCGQNCSLNLYS